MVSTGLECFGHGRGLLSALLCSSVPGAHRGKRAPQWVRHVVEAVAGAVMGPESPTDIPTRHACLVDHCRIGNTVRMGAEDSGFEPSLVCERARISEERFVR